MRLAARVVPVHGFTWFPLGEVVQGRHALWVKRGDVDQKGSATCNASRTPSRRPTPA